MFFFPKLVQKQYGKDSPPLEPRSSLRNLVGAMDWNQVTAPLHIAPLKKLHTAKDNTITSRSAQAAFV